MSESEQLREREGPGNGAQRHARGRLEEGERGCDGIQGGREGEGREGKQHDSAGDGGL